MFRSYYINGLKSVATIQFVPTELIRISKSPRIGAFYTNHDYILVQSLWYNTVIVFK
jgi:hypothetical protein